MRILVTGAGGFVGRHLLPALAARFPDAELVGIGDAPGFVALDVTNAAQVDALVARLRPDGCVHLAAVAAIGVARADPGRAWQVNLHGTLVMARAIMAHVPTCRLVYASTADLYGGSFRSGHPLDEQAVPAPLNTYGATKAAADLALGAMAAEGLRVVRVRPFNHTGRGQSADFVVPAFARQAMRIAAGLQPPVMSVGDLTPLRDFLDVRDVCDAYAACLDPAIAVAPGTILNIASGRAVRVGDVLAKILALAGVSPEIQTRDALLRASDIPFAAGDASAAGQLLGWQPKIGWTDTLAEVIADWKVRVQTEATA